MGVSEEGVAQLDLNINTNQVSLLVTTPQWRRAVRDSAMLVCRVCKFSGELLAHKLDAHNGVGVKWQHATGCRFRKGSFHNSVVAIDPCSTEEAYDHSMA